MLVSSDELKAQLKKYLKELRLPTILKCYEEQGQRAGEEGLSFEQYLLCLLELECEVRRQKPNCSSFKGIQAAPGKKPVRLRPQTVAGQSLLSNRCPFRRELPRPVRKRPDLR